MSKQIVCDHCGKHMAEDRGNRVQVFPRGRAMSDFCSWTCLAHVASTRVRAEVRAEQQDRPAPPGQADPTLAASRDTDREPPRQADPTALGSIEQPTRGPRPAPPPPSLLRRIIARIRP